MNGYIIVFDRTLGERSPRAVNPSEVESIMPDVENENLFIVVVGGKYPCKLIVDKKDAELLLEKKGAVRFC